MQGHIFIQEAPDELNVDDLRGHLQTSGCGAIVSFIGITRGEDGGEERELASCRADLREVRAELPVDGACRSGQGKGPVSGRTADRDAAQVRGVASPRHSDRRLIVNSFAGGPLAPR